MLRAAIKDTDNGSQQSRPRLIVEGNDDTCLWKVLAILSRAAPKFDGVSLVSLVQS